MRPLEIGVSTPLLFPLRMAKLFRGYGSVCHRAAVGARRLRWRWLDGGVRRGRRSTGAGAGARIPRHPNGQEQGGQDHEADNGAQGGIGDRSHTLLFSTFPSDLSRPRTRSRAACPQSIYRHEKPRNVALGRSEIFQENASFSEIYTIQEKEIDWLPDGLTAVLNGRMDSTT